MQIHDVFSARAELKFIEGEPEGTLGGLGAVYNVEDSHGDVITPGAFTDTLAEMRAAGRMPRMYVEHSAYKGGDPLPIGVWDSVTDEAEGLRVKGRLVGLSDPRIQRIAELVKAKAIDGLSIAFTTPPGGAVIGRKASEPHRTLNKVRLISVDLVGDPSNPLARVDSKSLLVQADQQAACVALGRAMQLHRATMSGGNSPTVSQRSEMMDHLQAAHMALTGSPVPQGMKSLPTLREAEAAIGMMFGLSNAQVRAVTEHGLKAWLSRDENREQVSDEAAAAAKRFREDLGDQLTGFTLPSF